MTKTAINIFDFQQLVVVQIISSQIKHNSTLTFLDQHRLLTATIGERPKVTDSIESSDAISLLVLNHGSFKGPSKALHSYPLSELERDNRFP